MFDDWGETLGGITDSIISGGEQFIDTWFDWESEKVRSAAPEENRIDQEPAVQPNGHPVAPANGALVITPTFLLGGALAMMLVGGGVYLAMRR